MSSARAGFRVVAHRGCAARGPENTVTAIRAAASHVDAVEVDVRRCGSGELVVFHDESVDRLTTETGRVDELSWRRLRALRVAGSDATVPRLRDVVETLPDDVALNVECKERGLATDVESAVADHPAEVFVSAFDASALSETSLPRALLFGEWDGSLETAQKLDCAYVHPHYDLVVDRPERVEAAHDAGFAVNVWTPPPAVVPRLRAVGVDGVIVDDWALPA